MEVEPSEAVVDQVAAELAALGYLGSGGKPYSAASIAAMVKTAAQLAPLRTDLPSKVEYPLS